MKSARLIHGFVAFLLLAHAFPSNSTDVLLRRVPDIGIQPQAALGADGTLHLVYYKGDPANGNIYYVLSKDGGATFSKPLQVSQSESAIALGNIRGARLAIGKNGRVHVAWMGSSAASPRGPNKESPMMYARMNDAGSAFEVQRNVISTNYGLDGGGAVAADDQGNVFVFWHGGAGVKGENERRVWVARSADEGKTFAAETSAIQKNTGACGCCGMGAVADHDGNVFVLYRAATEKVDRDMVLLISRDKGVTFAADKLDSWNATMCPMSSAALSSNAKNTAIAWENKGQVYFAAADSAGKPAAPLAAPGQAKGRKHPAIATNSAGQTLLVWTEGMGWQKGGSLAWQIFDQKGQPLEKGTSPGVPTWSLVAAVARPDGGFVIIY